MEDVAATQRYFRHLLPDPPSGYVQYFVKNPFIVRMYSYKQIGLLKLSVRKCIIYLDATGSLNSKPPSCSKKILLYVLTKQQTEYSTSTIPIAEMISSDHYTAKISDL